MPALTRFSHPGLVPGPGFSTPQEGSLAPEQVRGDKVVSETK